MIEITSLDHNGRGIGKINNKIIFVENAIPGEIVEITITNKKKKYSEAKCKSIIKKSENRIESKCPYFNNCGGCDILHMDYINQLREQGIEKREAILEAGRTRLRPVLMTALTTIFGLFAMVFSTGMGADLSKPMALVTIGGLTYGTLLTLLVIPCIYDIFHPEKKRKE